jgi:4-diphosphocytidyl-2-C-methyl-D-erythritol kinase
LKLLQLRFQQKRKNLSSFLSPAKLNLFFRVLHKRADGYHEIASLFQAIDLFDRLFFSFSDRDEISCTDPSIPCDSSNLVHKALSQFRLYRSTPPVKIHIEKKIPSQAGLGGGSSNAATTLWALNQLLDFPLTINELIQIGSSIGSDVPFFFSSGTSYCTGRGEILTPFSLPAPLTGFIAKPTFGLSTPLVYQHLTLSQLSSVDPLKALHSYPQFFNDLEVPSFQLEPRLIALRDDLRKSFEQVVMTGSGTTFFCLKGTPVPLPGVTFFPFQSVQRLDSREWY